jgi:hypothetical protein
MMATFIDDQFPVFRNYFSQTVSVVPPRQPEKRKIRDVMKFIFRAQKRLVVPPLLCGKRQPEPG